MRSVLFCVIHCVLGTVLAERHPRFSESFLDTAEPEDAIPDLYGRYRLIARHLYNDGLKVMWVNRDWVSKLTYANDPVTGLPYLVVMKAQQYQPKLYRMFRGKDHGYVVTNRKNINAFYRPVFNKLGEVDLEEIPEEDVGFTLKEATDL